MPLPNCVTVRAEPVILVVSCEVNCICFVNISLLIDFALM